MIAGEILEITRGTPMTSDGISVLCRRVWSDGIPGPIKLFYLTMRRDPGLSLALLIVGSAAAAVEEGLNDQF